MRAWWRKEENRVNAVAPSWPQLSLEEIKKRARILIIDDMGFAYGDLFRSDGYAIDEWKDVESLSRLEEGDFDLILLDVHGVGKKISNVAEDITAFRKAFDQMLKDADIDQLVVLIDDLDRCLPKTAIDRPGDPRRLGHSGVRWCTQVANGPVERLLVRTACADRQSWAARDSACGS